MREDEFQRLKKEWYEDTLYLSSMSERSSHPALLRIIAMGPDVVPLILRDLADEPKWWFTALRALTGEWPCPPGSAGNFRAMSDAWLRWADEKGIDWRR